MASYPVYPLSHIPYPPTRDEGYYCLSITISLKFYYHYQLYEQKPIVIVITVSFRDIIISNTPIKSCQKYFFILTLVK